MPQTRRPGSVRADVWPNITTLLSRICLETEPGPVRSYSARDQPGGLELFTGLQRCGWKEGQCQGLITGQCQPETWARFKTLGVASAPSGLAHFSILATVGIGTDDSDFGADLVTLSRSYAAFHHI